jgi:hypothetical protein
MVEHPQQKLSPGRIGDALGEAMIADHVTDLKPFIGQQVVRRDERARLFAGEFFALPLYLQMRTGQVPSGFVIVPRLHRFCGWDSVELIQGTLSRCCRQQRRQWCLAGVAAAPLPLTRLVVLSWLAMVFRVQALPRDLALEVFEAPFGLAQEAGIVDRRTVGVGVELLQAYINPHLGTRRLMGDLPLDLHTELDIVAAGPVEEAYSLELLVREGLNAARAHQPHPPDATTVSEGQMPPVGIELPARHLVLYRAVVMLETGIALLPPASWPGNLRRSD